MFSWILLAFLSALFAGITSILAKIGLKEVDSSVATALRTIVVLFFSWMMVLVSNCQGELRLVDGMTLFILTCSGLATGVSWLCYFKALQIGDVNKVTPIDKSSTILTMILAFIFFGESLSFLKIVSMVIMLLGTYLMIEKKKNTVQVTSNKWFIYALFSALFASLSAIIAKLGMASINSNLGTFIRTGVVLIMAWVVVLVQKKQYTIKDVSYRNWLFLVLSGIATGLSWLCYFKALQLGDASVVVPIDKLSIVVTIAFSYFVLKEPLCKKGFLGLILIILGTVLLLV